MNTPTILAWIGTTFQVVGALALAGRILLPQYCYALMGPGSAILFAVAVKQHDLPQAVLMLTFMGINAWGMSRWWIRA